MKKLLFVLFMFVSVSSFADLPFQPKFSWTPPNSFTDGSPLDPAADLSSYTINCTGASTITQTVSNTATEWTADPRQFSAGDYECTMVATDTAGFNSADSTPVNFTVGRAVPNPVITFTAQ